MAEIDPGAQETLGTNTSGGYDTSIIADCPKALDGPFPKIHLRGVAYAEMRC